MAVELTAPQREQTRARYPDESGFVERDGVRVFYEVYGSGEPTVLLLPTWSVIHSRHWKMQIPYLARHFRVVAFDGRGNGRSDHPTDPAAYHDDRFVDDIATVMDATATASAVLVGLCVDGVWRAIRLAGLLMLLVRDFLGIGLEGQRELDGGVVELGYRREWYVQRRWYAAERQADGKAVVADTEVPELVLDDDRHLVGKAFEQMLGDRNARHPRLERNVEMMLAGKAARLLDFAQHTADNGAQRILHDLVVGNQALGGLVAHACRW